MGTGLEALIGMVGLAVTAVVAFAVYRHQQRKRVRWVEQWVRDYLVSRYGKLPNALNVNCSDDTLWPVLVAFDDPLTRGRCRLQFACPGANATFSLLSEQRDTPPSGPGPI
jgi:hypothetical protein